MVFNNLLGPVLNPLLSLNPFYGILIMSVFVSLFTTIIYKYTTDQNRLKKLKADLKRYQKKINSLKDQPEKAMKVQKEMMSINGEYMKASLKSTLYTMIPLLLFFGWLGANLAFAPILPQQEFNMTVTLASTDGNVSLLLPEGLTMSDSSSKNAAESVMWTGIKGEEGVYDITFRYKDEEVVYPGLIITTKQDYPDSVSVKLPGSITTITAGYQKLLIFKNIVVFKDIPWVKNFGWLGAYFIFTMIFSTVLRKLFKLA